MGERRGFPDQEDEKAIRRRVEKKVRHRVEDSARERRSRSRSPSRGNRRSRSRSPGRGNRRDDDRRDDGRRDDGRRDDRRDDRRDERHRDEPTHPRRVDPRRDHVEYRGTPHEIHHDRRAPPRPVGGANPSQQATRSPPLLQLSERFEALHHIKVNLLPLTLLPHEERNAVCHLYDVTSDYVTFAKRMAIFEKRVRPSLEKSGMLPDASKNVINYDGEKLLRTVGEIKLEMAGSPEAEGWSYDEDAHQATWQDPRDQSETPAQFKIKATLGEPLRTRDIDLCQLAPGTADFRNFLNILIGASETTCRNRPDLRMLCGAFFSRSGLAAGLSALQTSDLHQTVKFINGQKTDVPIQFRRGEEAWSLAFPLLDGHREHAHRYQLNVGFRKLSAVLLHGVPSMHVELATSDTYIACEVLEAVTTQVAIARRGAKSDYMSNAGDEKQFRIRLEDFTDCHLEQRLCGDDERTPKFKFVGLHNKRTYRMYGFTKQPISQVEFVDTHANDEVTTVAKWTEKNYPEYAPLKYSHLPGIVTKPVLKDSSGRIIPDSSGRIVPVIPLELARLVEGQQVPLRNQPQLKGLLVQEEIKITTGGPRLGPQMRATRIQEVGESLRHMINDSGTPMNALHVSVPEGANALTDLSSDVVYRIRAPTIMMANQSEMPVHGQNGSYFYDKPFAVPCGPVNNWLIVSFESRRQFRGGDAEGTLRRFATDLSKNASRLGIVLNPNPDVEFYSASSPGNYEGELSRLACRRGQPAQLVIAVISDDKVANGEDLKPALTRWSLLGSAGVAGPPMACIQVGKLGGRGGRGPDATFFKLNLAKINARLGGHSTDVANLPPKMMVVGMDVYHPGPGSSRNSIAAFVASLDDRCARFQTSLREQALRRQETMAPHLFEVHHMQLRTYFESNRCWPTLIGFYRDGLGDSDFEFTAAKEIAEIRSVHTYLKITPALLFIVVQKRTATRLFDTAAGQGSYANVKPGTVVNIGEGCHFWMVSHTALQGTAKVPSYHILLNEGHSNPDYAVPRKTMQQIEALTFDLCYLHYKCPRSISVPAPVYFADLAAERAKDLYDRNGHFIGGDLNAEQSLRLFY